MCIRDSSPLGRANIIPFLPLLLTPRISLSVPPPSPYFLVLALPFLLSGGQKAQSGTKTRPVSREYGARPREIARRNAALRSPAIIRVHGKARKRGARGTTVHRSRVEPYIITVCYTTTYSSSGNIQISKKGSHTTSIDPNGFGIAAVYSGHECEKLLSPPVPNHFQYLRYARS